MYVMVVEEYPENYLGNVRAKDSILNYKKRFWGYTEPKNEKEIADLIAHNELVFWSAVIDLDKMEFLTEEEEIKIFNTYSSYKDFNSIRMNEEWFYNQFNFNDESA